MTKYRSDQFTIHFPDKTSSPVQPHLFELSLVRDTQRCWEQNGLYTALSNLIGPDCALQQMLHYNLGTSKWHGGSTISWQLDNGDPLGYFTGGLVEQFDPSTGIAANNSYTTIHDILSDQFSIEIGKPPAPALFGSHLTQSNTNKPIVICCNPITALVGSYHCHQYQWLATPQHPLVDLAGPSFITAFPAKETIILFGEPGYETAWSHYASVIRTFTRALKGPCVNLLLSSSISGFAGLAAQWIHQNPNEALIELEITFL